MYLMEGYGPNATVFYEIILLLYGPVQGKRLEERWMENK